MLVLHKEGVLEETKSMKSAEFRAHLTKKWNSMSDKEKEPYFKKYEILNVEY
jgi:hypothetical protein